MVATAASVAKLHAFLEETERRIMRGPFSPRLLIP